MSVIGLTGGIATGKSTVCRLLKERGARVVSADEIAHAVTGAGSPVIEAIIREFGAEFVTPDGSLDRSAMAKRVFNDPDARRKLEGITHPLILQEMERQIEEARRSDDQGLIVAEVPLLFEAGMESWFDAVLTVVASDAKQRERLCSRSGLSAAEADMRIKSQIDVNEKAARSRFVLNNDGSLEDLSESVDRLLPSLRAVDKREHLTHE
jgi:dephospho-CoA kinase